MTDAFTVLDTLDTVLKGDTIDTTEVASSRQDIGNSIIIPIILTIIAVLFTYSALNIWAAILVLALAVLIIGLTVWYVSTKRYILEKDRIISEFGIIYRVRKSILYKKFNFIEKSQGFFGKIFKNGTLSIYTL
ncbi:MAG: PH domain-containing protein [Patescibacteria group bacterium]